MEQKRKRIESIDALRAFALFGVIMVHANCMYSFMDEPSNDFTYITPLGNTISNYVTWLFDDKSRTIFSTLFGISFYLILRNPAYSISRFRWRCFLLIGFGLFDKIFSTHDILLWYGINGVFLSIIPVRKMKPSLLLTISALLYLFSFINLFPLFSNISFPIRYSTNTTFMDFILYPIYFTVISDICTRIYVDSSMTLACFVFGYYLGKSSIIENIDNFSTFKKALSSITLFVISLILYRISNYNHAIWHFSTLIGAIALSITFIYMYNKVKLLSYMSCYGKLGLTNYSTQYIIGTMIVMFIAIPLKQSIEYVFLYGLVLYFLQLLFAIYWTKKFIYGPFEWLWRIATYKRYTPNSIYKLPSNRKN